MEGDGLPQAEVKEGVPWIQGRDGPGVFCDVFSGNINLAECVWGLAEKMLEYRVVPNERAPGAFRTVGSVRLYRNSAL